MEKWVTLEFKRPHPRALYGGGIFGKEQHISHIGAMMSKAETLLDEYEIPHQNTVYYAFHTGMKSSVQNSNIRRAHGRILRLISSI